MENTRWAAMDAMENLKAIDGVNIDGPWYLGNLLGHHSFWWKSIGESIGIYS